MKQVYARLLFSLMALVMVVACGKNSNDDGGAPINTSAGTYTGPGSNGRQVQMGLYYVVGQGDANQYLETIRGFLSTTNDPMSVGNVNPQNAVRMALKLAVAQNGILVPNLSELHIEVADSFSAQAGNFKINMVSNASGNVSNGQVNVAFADQYGKIIITGTYAQGGTFQGTVSFQNNTSNYSVNSGTLGSFQAPASTVVVPAQ